MGQGATSALRCPRCGATMARARGGAVEVDACPGCGAVWLDADELEALQAAGSLEALDAAVAARRAKSQARLETRACPRDLTPLVALRLPHARDVALDGCPTCGGVLADAGELSAIARSSRVGPQALAEVRAAAASLNDEDEGDNPYLARVAKRAGKDRVYPIEEVLKWVSAGLCLATLGAVFAAHHAGTLSMSGGRGYGAPVIIPIIFTLIVWVGPTKLSRDGDSLFATEGAGLDGWLWVGLALLAQVVLFVMMSLHTFGG